MKRTRIKVISLSIAITIMLSVISTGIIPSDNRLHTSYAQTRGAPCPIFGLGNIGRGYNGLSGDPLINESFNNAPIFRANSHEAFNDWLDFTRAGVTRHNANTSRSTAEFMNQIGVETGIRQKGSVELNIGFVKATSEFEQWMGVNIRNTLNEATEILLHQSHTWHRAAIYRLDLDRVPNNIVQQQLTDEFLSDITNPNLSPNYLFNKYGTHFPTEYTLGGWVTAGINTINESVNREFHIRAGLEGTITALTEVNRINRDSSHTQSAYADIFGGVGGINDIEAWLLSFDRREDFWNVSQFLTLPGDGMNRTKFVGIWELLPQGHEARYYELARVFVEEARNQESEFFNRFVNQSQLPSNVARLTVDQRIARGDLPSNVHRISTETQLSDMIRIYPSDSFVLTNDIVLTTPWIPVVNFSGLIDGNGHTIRGFIIDERASTQGQSNAGFFRRTSNGAAIRNLNIELGQHFSVTHTDLGGTFNVSVHKQWSGTTDNRPPTTLGILVGRVEGNLTVENVDVSGGEIAARASRSSYPASTHVGGLIGEINSGTVEISRSRADVSVRAISNTGSGNSTSSAGGLIGTITSGSVLIRDSFVGRSEQTGILSRSRHEGNIFQSGTAISNSGGFVGWQDGGNLSISNSYVHLGLSTSTEGFAAGQIRTRPTDPSILNRTQSNRGHFIGSGGNNTILNSFNRNEIRDNPQPANWDFENVWKLPSPPTHQCPISGLVALDVTYTNGIPTFYEGELFTQNLSDIMTVTLDGLNVTPDAQLRHDFSNPENPQAQVVYNDNGTIFVAELEFDFIRDTTTPTMRSMFISTPPNTRIYSVGDLFDPTGMVVTAGYTDFTTQVLNPSNFTIDPNRALTTNDRAISITMGDFSTTQPIMVLSEGITTLIISEVNATGNNGWLEIHNPTNEAISCKGLHLSNDEQDLQIWQMPAVIIKAGDTVRIRANSNNICVTLKRMITNFNINIGDTIILINASGDILSEFTTT